jgi:hypothetical protein
MATAAQVRAFQIAQQTSIAQGIGQSSFFHRHREGTLTPVPNNPNAVRYNDPDPRTGDLPTDAAVLVWAVMQPIRVRGNSTDGGDVKAARAWMELQLVQIPAIDSNGNAIVMQDEDILILPDGFKCRLENPTLSSDQCFWTANAVRFR